MNRMLNKFYCSLVFRSYPLFVVLLFIDLIIRLVCKTILLPFLAIYFCIWGLINRFPDALDWLAGDLNAIRVATKERELVFEWVSMVT